VSSVDPKIHIIFGTLTLRAIDWYINDLVLRGSGGGGGVRGGLRIWGGLQNFTGPLSRNITVFLDS